MKDIKYPITFDTNICIHCAEKGTLKYKDKFGKLSPDPIYPIQSIICTKCDTEYFIKWIPDRDNMKPVATSYTEISKFENSILEFSNRSKRNIDLSM